MLKLVEAGNSRKCIESTDSVALTDHKRLLESYFQSHRIRNHSPKTIAKEKRFLESWFKEHGLYVWQAMEPVVGRERIVDYGNTLLESEISTDTVRSYLGILRRYFSYVIEYPFVGTHPVRRVQDTYGPIDQSVTEFDMPHYVYEGERLGVPLDPEKLYDCYAVLRDEYLKKSGWESVRARNYTMAVLAGESGLRADELLHLEIKKDLFFESKKLQTRFAKGMKGSGKRARITLFSPLARDSVRYYLKEHREKLSQAPSDYLFVSPSGKVLSYAAINRALHEMVEVAQKSGFPIAPHMGWHWFRRIFATRFIERFPNQLSVLVKLLGHVSPNTVHCYIRHSEAWMNEQIQKVLEGGSPWQSIGD